MRWRWGHRVQIISNKTVVSHYSKTLLMNFRHSAIRLKPKYQSLSRSSLQEQSQFPHSLSQSTEPIMETIRGIQIIITCIWYLGILEFKFEIQFTYFSFLVRCRGICPTKYPGNELKKKSAGQVVLTYFWVSNPSIQWSTLPNWLSLKDSNRAGEPVQALGQLKLLQKDIAKQVQVSPATISRELSRNKTPRPETIKPRGPK